MTLPKVFRIIRNSPILMNLKNLHEELYQIQIYFRPKFKIYLGGLISCWHLVDADPKK
jgi:hypothetical protein